MKVVINPIRPMLCDHEADFHVLVRLQSEPVAGFQPTPLNLALVVDHSGSMSGSKLDEAKRCVVDLVRRMRASDTVGIVLYEDQVQTLLPMSTVDQVSGVIDSMMQTIRPEGSTALHAGWLRGGELVAPGAGRESACHVILLSDGQANRGLTHPASICEQVAALAGAGVTTTTVGLGAGFNEEVMTAMAKAGQGRAHYGERAMDLAETFDAEIGLLSELQWRQVNLSITTGTGVELLNTYERADSGWRMPSVAMGSECWALLRMPMRSALACQREHGTALAIRAEATDTHGQRSVFSGQLPVLPVVTQPQYEAEIGHELVERRIHELAAAQLQLRIRQAALQGDWIRAEELMAQLEQLGQQEPWIAASIAFARQLLRERDHDRMSKEMLYKSHKMHSRLSSTDESMFSLMSDRETPAFLRRKMAEGRRTGP